MRRRGRNTHMAEEKGCPPHRLLFGNWGNCADPGAHESDEGDVGVGGVDDIANVCFGSGGVVRVKP